MNYKKQYQTFGYIKYEKPKKVTKRKPRTVGREDRKIIELCLTCDRKKCNGYCDKIKGAKKNDD